MSFRRMLPFLLINIVVSLVVVLGVLYWWENRDEAADVVDAGNVNVSTAVPINNGETAVSQSEAVPTEAPAPVEQDPVHVVQAGDTLGSISDFYTVSIDDVMAVNGITNPNLISVGEQIIIPVNGIPTPVPVVVPTEETAVVLTPAPIATQPIQTGETVIEVSQVIGIGELNTEAVQIRNIGSNSVALIDWKIVDQDGNFYTFGQITLFGEGAGILLHTESGSNGATEIYWGQPEPVWRSGELVTLLNAGGGIVATYEIP